VAAGQIVPDQTAYDRFYQSIDPGWRSAFHSEFYRQRARFREDDPGRWLAFHRDYPWFSVLLRRHGERGRLAVVTAKDRPSVTALLAHFGLDDLFDPELIFDKDTGVQKTAHLTRLAECTRTPYPAIVFVDDKVNHLRKTAPLGVRGILAGWGENGTREHEEARRCGLSVAFPENAERLLFG
jgi:phosphoglycolate phosphatase-like HAD superfamily hydrolase